MQNPFRSRTSRFILTIFTILTILACQIPTFESTKKLVTEEDYLVTYNVLITKVRTAQMELVNGKNCVAAAYTDINTQLGLANLAMQAEVKRTEAYASTIDTFFNSPYIDPATNAEVPNPETGEPYTRNEYMAKSQADLQAGLDAYTDEDGNPVSAQNPEALDLGKVANANATPAQLALSLNVVALTYTQAPMPAANFDPILTAQRVTTEKTNMVYACSKQTNVAVNDYNIERGKITGEIAAKLAELLHMSELPETLPYFELQGPQQVAPVPTFGAP